MTKRPSDTPPYRLQRTGLDWTGPEDIDFSDYWV